MQALITIFLIATFLWVVYWTLVRPSILDSVEDDFARLKSKIEWAYIKGDPGSQSEAAQKLATVFESSEFTRLISIGQVILCLFKQRAEIKASWAKEKQLFDSSPVWIRELKQEHDNLVIKSALSNSFAWWLPLACISLAANFSKTIAVWWAYAASAADKVRSGVKVQCPIKAA